MAIGDADLWHQVHAQREDGVDAMFLVRDVVPRRDQPRIFVVEMPYPITDLSKLPDAAGYRRLDAFQEQWVEPACDALGWTFVASKSADGSSFFYLYGDGDPNALLEKLAPFDGALGFFNDVDADWAEYAALRELVVGAETDDGAHVHGADCGHEPARRAARKATPKRAARATTEATTRAKTGASVRRKPTKVARKPTTKRR